LGPSLKRNVVVLGATGSIGTQTLDVIRRLPDRLRVVGLSAHRSADLLKQRAGAFGVPPDALALGDDADLTRLAALPEADVVVVAVAGAIGTKATLAALSAGKDVALATKEVLVSAGALVMDAAKKAGARVLPIDSEHSAIFQCLAGVPDGSIARLWLTASGGPFRDGEWAGDKLYNATVSEALNHPTWPGMGRMILVYSATLMNKALEMIEAAWLFSMPIDAVNVVVHPQSIVHSLVELRDGAVLAQLGIPDMRVPIQYALCYPERIDAGLPRLDVATMGTLTFEAPDTERFPALGLARRAASLGGTAPAVLNGANEAAVGLFLGEKIKFGAMTQLVERALDAHSPDANPDLEGILNADAWARQFVGRASEA